MIFEAQTLLETSFDQGLLYLLWHFAHFGQACGASGHAQQQARDGGGGLAEQARLELVEGVGGGVAFSGKAGVGSPNSF